jgi:Glycosyltransferase family 87
MSRRGQWSAFVAAIILAAATFLGILALSGPHTSVDFVCLYGAGKTILQGEGAQLYDYSTQLRVQRPYTGQAIPLIDAHAPPEALVFLPFALFSYPTAYLLWAGANLFLLGICVFLLRPWFLKLPPWDVLLFAAAVLIPVLMDIWHGQDSLLILLFYVGAFRLLERDRDFKAGAVLALALFKVQLVAPFLVLGVRRRTRRFFGGFLAAAGGLAVVSLATVGLRATLGYPAFLLSLNRNSEWIFVRQIHPDWMVNLRGLAYQLLHPSVPARFLDVGVAAISVLLVLWATLAPARRGGRREKVPPDSDAFAIGFSLDLLVTLLVSWYLYMYDVSLLFLPALLLLAATRSSGTEMPRRGLLLRASLMVVLIGELCAIGWCPLPKQLAAISFGLLLLLWACVSLERRRRSAAAA